MLSFNSLLSAEGIDPSCVKLVRHQDERKKDRPTVYQVWRRSVEKFERYQCIQRLPRFKGAKYLASFLATPFGETLFIGIYEVGRLSKVPEDEIDPVSGINAGGFFLYSLDRSPLLSDFRDRLVVEWGAGYRAWVQNAKSKNKPVLEIRRTAAEPPFPGFLNFQERMSLLDTVPVSWRQTLSSVRGVYLLTHPKSGQHYVGSAIGEGGFWGRWEDYAASGHGGNARMIDLERADYTISILEVVSSLASAKEIIDSENRWKVKLGTRKNGLNAN